MAKSLLGGPNLNYTLSNTHTNSINLFVPCSGGFNDGAALTEAQAQTSTAAGTYSGLTIGIAASSSTASITFRKNGVNGNQTVSVGSGLTGWFTDSGHSDTVISTDAVCLNIITGGVVTVKNYTEAFDSGGAPIAYLAGICAQSSSGTLPGVFTPFAGQWFDGQDATEANQQLLVRAPGTYSNLEVHEQVAATWRFRKNSANGNQNLPSTTGAQRDSSNTDSVVNSDLVNLQMGAASAAWNRLQVRFTSSGSTADMMATGLARNISGGPIFLPFISDSNVNGTRGAVEADMQHYVPFATKFTNLRFFITSSNVSSGLTFRFRKNGATGNQVISSGAGGLTGWFEDSSDADSVVSGDLCCVSVEQNVVVSGLSVTALTYGPASTTETATASITLGGVAFNAHGGRKETATAMLSLTGVSFNTHASVVAASAQGTLTISKVGFLAGVLDFHTGSGVSLSFSTFGA